MRTLRIILASTALLLITSAVAQAARPANPEELAEFAPALIAGTGLQLTANCISGEVSTVDQTWAAAYGTGAEGCPAGNGVLILNRPADAWVYVTAGSADRPTCPAFEQVPVSVQADLKLCTLPYPRPPRGKAWAAKLLLALPSADELTAPSYSRAKFRHWIPVGRTGCNARYYVLWQENLRRPKPKCSSTSGRWVSAFDGLVVTRAGELDVDHMVPLAEAWRSGAATKWDAATRQRFANDVSYPHSLIAVSASSNRSKGDNDPETWLPPLETFRCAYVVRWIAVKHRWRLAVDAGEFTALDDALLDCPRASTLLPIPPKALVTNVKPQPKPQPPAGGGGGSSIPLQPDRPGDQDCSDFDGPVLVLPGDPDRLDADGDGVGCEG